MTIDILSFIVAIAAYLIGCFPTAHLLVRATTSKQILQEGSGNMGAMNSYEVTGKKWIGLLVTLVDAFKGFLAVQLAVQLGTSFFGITMAAVFVILGHCFNAFFNFKGGRGLASAIGICLAINPLPLILWCLMYLTGYYIIRRDIHVGSVSGTLGVMILMYTTPSLLLDKMMFVANYDISQFKLMVFMICLIIFARHVEPMRELFKKLQTEQTD